MKNLLVVYSMYTRSKHTECIKVYYEFESEIMYIQYKTKNHWFAYEDKSMICTAYTTLRAFI